MPFALTALSNPTRSFAYDNAGNTISDSASYTSSYNLAGRLRTLTSGAQVATFDYDAQGRRIRKRSSTGASSTVIFVYDQVGHLLGEYGSAGETLREYVWLGDTPLAMITPAATAGGAPTVYFIHTDHLDTPRVLVDRTNAIRWTWLAEPFGTTAPNTNPQGLGAVVFNLRFPGQYADAETGLSYNGFRDYDAGIGRYVQSDPIGLAGGINTYSYVGGNPLSYTDPRGLVKWSGPYHARSVIEGVGAGWVDLELTSECVNGKRFKARVKGVGPGFGVGVKGIIGGDTYGTVNLKDPYDDIRPDRLSGTFTWASAGIAIGTWDRSVGRVVVGSAHGWNPDHGSGLDIGINAILGSSTLLGGTWEDCPCETK